MSSVHVHVLYLYMSASHVGDPAHQISGSTSCEEPWGPQFRHASSSSRRPPCRTQYLAPTLHILPCQNALIHSQRPTACRNGFCWILLRNLVRALPICAKPRNLSSDMSNSKKKRYRNIRCCTSIAEKRSQLAQNRRKTTARVDPHPRVQKLTR